MSHCQPRRGVGAQLGSARTRWADSLNVLLQATWWVRNLLPSWIAEIGIESAVRRVGWLLVAMFVVMRAVIAWSSPALWLLAEPQY